ncbi:photoreceptor cilium actin regulator [Corythoichthys intestinalis]|uniref:photoreceptor cilium actin regulator n=1 Tax=Corythoichthys intestinalis TaxID=161448 RepID=UPI0025A581B3|nr:photoreceptor cilium actin regulator [Corythoichthys intestinalis]XP_061798663.1 photoreceptor cilium actin regulator-like [Nerophis lumbriciformis]
MGCSPSRGNTLVNLGSLRRGRMLPPAPQEQPREAHYTDGDHNNCTGSTVGDTKGRKTSGQKAIFQRDGNMPPQEHLHATVCAPEVKDADKLKSQRMENSIVIQKKDKNGNKQEITEKKSGKKPRRRGMKVLKKTEKEMPKIDFPEPLVKAHQAAYGFLNPSINKYDVVLGLLEQATQTQASLQPMVSFMALRYEEIIRALEKIVDEGEIMLKEYGDQLAWPCQMKKLSSAAALKSISAIEPPPDLLQQLLQYTTQRMQNVSQTVGGIGDSALEEAVDYFSSVSELLEEKLKVKRAVETRIMRLTSRIELASLRKLGPEDSALFSEDSGIGAESESIAGSEKHHRRVSCESSGTNRATPFSPVEYTSMTGMSVKSLACQMSPSASLTSLNSLASMCTMMSNAQGDSLLGSVSFDDGEEDDDENYKSDGETSSGQVSLKKQANYSHEKCEPKPRCLPFKFIENPKNIEMTIKMKNALNGKIHCVQAQSAGAKSKVAVSPKSGTGQWPEEKRPTIKRSQTTVRRSVVKTTPAAKEKRSRSAESLRSRGDDPTLPELDRSREKIGQRLKKVNKRKENTKGNLKTTPSTSSQKQRTSPDNSPKQNQKHPTLEKDGNLRERVAHLKCLTKTQGVTTKLEEDDVNKDKKIFTGVVKATPPPSPPASPRPSSGLYRGRNSVKKLIDTFSQGIEEMDSPNVVGPLRGVRKCGVPVLPGLGNVSTVLNYGKTSCRSQSTSCEKNDYLELDHLPPPTLEVLLDNSFESELSCGVAAQGPVKAVTSPMVKRAGPSQRLRASVQSGPVLPSKGGVPRCLKGSFPVKRDSQVTTSQTTINQPDIDPVMEINSTRLKKFRKIRYFKDSSDSESEKYSINYGATSQSSDPDDSMNVQENDNLFIREINTTVSQVPPTSVASTQPLATSLLSKGRILPSTPSISNSSHRRLPSPRNFKKSPTPPSSASPPVNRKLTTPPEGQMHLSSSPVLRPNTLTSSYPLKAPSPPASPKIQRWSRENSAEESARMISNARSVFCPISPSLFEAQPSTTSQLFQAWTSVGGALRSTITRGNRGRCSMSAQGPQPVIRQSLSKRRTSMDLTPRNLLLSMAETFGSEPAICTQGLDDEPAKKAESWASQSDLRVIPRSASHPDLYVVGQALHRDKIDQ